MSKRPMPHPDVVRYLRENAQYTRETLWRKLREAGYPDAEISAAEAYLGGKVARPLGPRTSPFQRFLAPGRGREMLIGAAVVMILAWIEGAARYTSYNYGEMSEGGYFLLDALDFVWGAVAIAGIAALFWRKFITLGMVIGYIVTMFFGF